MDTLPEHIADLIQQGRKLEAIKLIREESGVGLAEAKAAVDQLSGAQALGRSEAAAPEDVDAEVQALAYEGRTIEAIKRLREQTGLGLKEAKALIEQLPVDPDHSPASSPILFLVIVGALLLFGVALAVFFASAG